MTNINYEAEVKRVYPLARLGTLYRYAGYTKRPEFVVSGYYIHISTEWIPRAENIPLAWQSAYNRINKVTT